MSALTNGSLGEQQAQAIFEQGCDAVVFALLQQAKRLAEAHGNTDPSIAPSTPSGKFAIYKKLKST